MRFLHQPRRGEETHQHTTHEPSSHKRRKRTPRGSTSCDLCLSLSGCPILQTGIMGTGVGARQVDYRPAHARASFSVSRSRERHGSHAIGRAKSRLFSGFANSKYELSHIIRSSSSSSSSGGQPAHNTHLTPHAKNIVSSSSAVRLSSFTACLLISPDPADRCCLRHVRAIIRNTQGTRMANPVLCD